MPGARGSETVEQACTHSGHACSNATIPAQTHPPNCISQQLMQCTDLYQLRLAVMAPGFCMPAIMPSCSHIGPSTSAASLVANPSISLPDDMACSPRPGTSSSSIYLNSACPLVLQQLSAGFSAVTVCKYVNRTSIHAETFCRLCCLKPKATKSWQTGFSWYLWQHHMG